MNSNTKAKQMSCRVLLFTFFFGSVAASAAKHDALPGEEGPSRFAAYGVVIPEPAPDRSANEGEGPFDRLVIENVMLVDGLGSPPRRPVSIVIEGNRISQVMGSSPKPETGEKRMDANGMTALPGFIDAHVHIESSLLPPTEFARLAVRHGMFRGRVRCPEVTSRECTS